MRHRVRTLILLLVVLVLPGCAVGEEPVSTSETGLQPRVAPEKTRVGRPHADRSAGKGRSAHRNDRPSGGVTPPPKKSEQSSEPDESPTGTGPSSAPPTTGRPSDVAAASVADRAGDAQGLGVPAYADLTGASLRRSDGRYDLRVSAVGDFPTGSDAVMHVICFADTDGDGEIDYELWATLADDGWSGTWRHPDGAEFGSASGISVRPDGRELDLSFDASRLGGAQSFRWLVGAEHGTLEQQASGTMSKDYAPDRGAVRFPS